MFLLGFMQSYITKQNLINGGLKIMGNGILASSFDFAIGYELGKGLN